MKTNHRQLTTTARTICRARTLALAGALLPLIGMSSTAWAQGAAQAPGASPAAAAANVINPEAIQALKTMGLYLRSLKSFTVRAESTTDEVLDSGQKIQFASTVDLRARLPDRLRMDVKSDNKQRELYYNGKTVTQYAPRLKYYASVATPGTVRETLVVAASKYDLTVPLADLFFWATDKASLDDITAGLYVGPAHVGGLACDHYAFRQEGIDWQIWIQSGKTPLPCKLLITSADLPSQPQYTTTLHWDVNTAIDDKTFTFVPPKGAQKIEFATAIAVAK
jgi:hypothetical protein